LGKTYGGFLLEHRHSLLPQQYNRQVEYVVGAVERGRDLLRRGVFDPQLVPFLQQAYTDNIRDSRWFEERFGSYLELIRTSVPTVIEDQRKSYADYCNFEAELARVRRAKLYEKEKPNDAYETIAQVLHVADTNLQTLINELLLGASTRYGYKFVLNTQTNESKVVFYDSLVHGEETWQEAWTREDVRISFLRSVEQTEKHLQLREWVNVYVFNALCEQWEEHLYNPDKKDLYYWMSPPPAKKGFGYGTISLQYVYAPYRSGKNEVTVGARTIISEYSTAHLGRLARDLVADNDESSVRIGGLPHVPGDIDLLSLVFRVRDDFVDYDLTRFISRVESLLGSYAGLDWVFPAHARRQEKHVASRIADEDTRDIIQRRLKPWRERVLCALVEEQPADVLRRLVVELEETAKQIYADVRKEAWEVQVKQSGVAVSDEMRQKKEREVRGDIKTRQENSNCRSQNRKTRLVERMNADGVVEMVEEEESDASCMICCRNEWVDEITQIAVQCNWKAEASDDPTQQLTSCPWCGWNPEKPKSADLQKIMGPPTRFNEGSENQLKMDAFGKYEDRFPEIVRQFKKTIDQNEDLTPIPTTEVLEDRKAWQYVYGMGVFAPIRRVMPEYLYVEY